MGKSRVMLISPPSTIISGKFKLCVPPLGLGYLAAVLEGKGHEVRILDCPLEGFHNETRQDRNLTFGLGPDAIYAAIKDYSPDLVGISCLFSVAVDHALKIAESVKRIDAGIPVVLGGHHPSVSAEALLKNKNVDYIVIGEGESGFLDLVTKLDSGDRGAICQIDGMAGRNGDGKIFINPRTEFIGDLDRLPMPARHLFDMEGYFKINLFMNTVTAGRRVATMITSRGCPFHCIFCATTGLWGNRFRARSTKCVLDEIAFLKERYGVDEIQFEDDNMMWDRARAGELFDGMIERSFDIRWCAPQGIRVDTIDENICGKMKESGCYEVAIGVESGDQEVLDKIVRKGIRLEKVREAARLLKKYGIRATGFFLVGLPGEKIGNMEETFRFARKLGLDRSSFMAPTPLVGTELYEICRKRGYLTEGFSITNTDYSVPCISTEDFSPGEVTRLMARQLVWTNLLPFFRNPLFFIRMYFLFVLRRPAEVLRYINLLGKNMFKR